MFSPVDKPVSIALVLIVVIMKDWKLTQLDISNAFLHGNLEERVVISQPLGFVDGEKPHHVCLLKKTFYVLKQASMMWFKRLREFLVSLGFIQGWEDPFLFILSKSEPLKPRYTYLSM